MIRGRDIFFDRAVRIAYRIGLRPNHLTLLQTPFYAAMVWAGLERHLFTLAVLQIVVISLDGADGMMARRMGIATRAGAILDAIFDLIGIVLVLVLAAVIWPTYAWICIATLVANLVLYLQNALFHQKFVSLVRGPVVTAIWLEATFSGIMWIGAGLPLATTLLILAFRQAAWRRYVGTEPLRWDALKPEFPRWSQ